MEARTGRLSGFNHPGRQLAVKAADGRTAACQIVELPFYDKDKLIPRGLDKNIP